MAERNYKLMLLEEAEQFLAFLHFGIVIPTPSLWQPMVL